MVVSKKKVKDKIAENSANYGDLEVKIPGIEFMTILEILNVITIDAKIAFHEGLLECMVVDPSHVSMVHLNYGGQALEQKKSFSIDINRLLGLMKKAKWGKTTGRGDAKTHAEMLELYVGDEGNISILHENEDTKKIVRYKCLDPNTVADWPRMPKVDMPAKVTLSGEDFLNKIEFCNSVGDLMRLKIEDGKLITSTNLGYKGNDLTSVSTELSNESAEVRNDGVGGSTASQYSLSYLRGIAKVLKKQEITIESGDNYPIRITVNWNFGYESEKKLDVQFFLAPRVESDY